VKRVFHREWEEPAVPGDRGSWPRITFRAFVVELAGIGFITSSNLLERLHEKEERDHVVINPGPISGACTWQGKLKALAHLMRAEGHRPVKRTHGVRGYRL
jgi:hypothetical protein